MELSSVYQYDQLFSLIVRKCFLMADSIKNAIFAKQYCYYRIFTLWENLN